MIYNPIDGCAYWGRLRLHAFGCRSASNILGRLISRLQFPGNAIIRVNVGSFADDVFPAEPSQLTDDGNQYFKRACAILNFATSDWKGRCRNTDIFFLGDVVSVSDTVVNSAPDAVPVGITLILSMITLPRIRARSPWAADL